MMSKEAKKNYVEEMKKTFTDSESVMIAQYQGLNVNELDSLRKELRDKIKYYEKKFKNTSIPRPIYWSGIKIKPIEFEFWKQGEFRIHSREQYLLRKNNWTVRLLSP